MEYQFFWITLIMLGAARLIIALWPSEASAKGGLRRWIAGGLWSYVEDNSDVAVATGNAYTWRRGRHEDTPLTTCLKTVNYSQPLWAVFIPMCRLKRRLMGGIWWHVGLFGPGAEGAGYVWVHHHSASTPPTAAEGGWPGRDTGHWRTGTEPAEIW